MTALTADDLMRASEIVENRSKQLAQSFYPDDAAAYVALASRLHAAAQGQVMVPVDLWGDIYDFIRCYEDVRDGEDGPLPNDAMILAQRMGAAAPGAKGDADG